MIRIYVIEEVGIIDSDCARYTYYTIFTANTIMGEAELTRFFQAPAATAAGAIDGPQAKSLYIFCSDP